MSEPNEWNASIIAEFRKNHGKVGGYFEGAPLFSITPAPGAAKRVLTRLCISRMAIAT
jgi:hypothetical protein